MTSDRQRALIERLLSESEEAVVAGQWDVVARHAQSVLALDSSNPDGLALKGAAERMGAAIPTQVPPRAELPYWPDGVIASFDIETTGLSPESDEIIQVAILYIDRDGRVLPNSWTAIVNPGQPSSPQAFAVHGITDDRAVREGISAAHAAGEILIRLRAVADAHIPLVVYNAPFDLGFMHVRASRFGTVLPELIVIDPLVCDRALDARRTGSRTLGAVAAYYGCTADGLHDAQNDAAVAVAIARAIAQKYPQIRQSTLIDLHRQQSIWSRGQRGAVGWPVPDRYLVSHTPDTINPNDTDPELRMGMVTELLVALSRGRGHREQADLDAAIADYTSIIETYSDDTDPVMRMLVAYALHDRGFEHSEQDDLDAAIADFTSIIETYSDDTDPKMRLQVARALRARGGMHWTNVTKQYDLDAAIADYTSIIETYSDDSDPWMRLQVARALRDRGNTHRIRGERKSDSYQVNDDDLDAAIADFTSLIETYSDDTEQEMRREVVQALYRRGGMQSWRFGSSDDTWVERHTAAIADYTSIIETYSDDTDPKMRMLVAEALRERGDTRTYIDFTGAPVAAAIADFTSIIETYSDDPEQEMRWLVAKARERRGYRGG